MSDHHYHLGYHLRYFWLSEFLRRMSNVWKPLSLATLPFIYLYYISKSCLLEFSILGHISNCIYTFMFIHNEENGGKWGEREKGVGKRKGRDGVCVCFSRGGGRQLFTVSGGKRATCNNQITVLVMSDDKILKWLCLFSHVTLLSSTNVFWNGLKEQRQEETLGMFCIKPCTPRWAKCWYWNGRWQSFSQSLGIYACAI